MIENSLISVYYRREVPNGGRGWGYDGVVLYLPEYDDDATWGIDECPCCDEASICCVDDHRADYVEENFDTGDVVQDFADALRLAKTHARPGWAIKTHDDVHGFVLAMGGDVVWVDSPEFPGSLTLMRRSDRTPESMARVRRMIAKLPVLHPRSQAVNVLCDLFQVTGPASSSDHYSRMVPEYLSVTLAHAAGMRIFAGKRGDYYHINESIFTETPAASGQSFRAHKSLEGIKAAAERWVDFPEVLRIRFEDAEGIEDDGYGGHDGHDGYEGETYYLIAPEKLPEFRDWLHRLR